MRLSIIIPVYNVEQWIGRCLESCLNQGLSPAEYEIIVVNDGTKDNSMDIVKKFKNHYPNIVIISQPNGGLSLARNTGLAASKGGYVWFVDGDDVLEENYANRLLNIAESKNLDVLCFGINLHFPNGKKTPYPIYYKVKDQVYSGMNFLCDVEMPPAAWCALYRRNYLEENRLQFYPNIFHEDFEFTPRAYTLADRIMYWDEHIYNYEQRDGSIMNSKDKASKKGEDLLVVCDSLYSFAQAHLTDNENMMNCFVSKINFSFSQSLKNHTGSIFDIAKYKDKPYYPLNIRAIANKKEYLKYKLINFSLPLYLVFSKINKL